MVLYRIAVLCACASICFVAARAQEPPAKDGGAEYVASLEAVLAGLARGDLREAQAALDATEMKNRGFEWLHLRLCVELAGTPGLAGGSARTTSGHRFELGANRANPVSLLSGSAGAPRAALFSARGERIVSAADELAPRVWSARTGDMLRALNGHEGVVTSIAISPDGARAVSGSKDGSARVWDVESGASVLVLRAGAGAVRAVAWSPDGSTIATAPSDNTVRLWPNGGSEVRLALRPGSVSALAFRPDSKQIAVATDEGGVRVFDVASGEEPFTTRGHKKAALALAWAPSGATLVSTSAVGDVIAWDASNGTASANIRSDGPAVRAIAFSPDGTRLVTADDEGNVQVLDSARGTLLLALRKHTGVARGAAFSPQGDRLLTCGDDRALRIYETDAETARAAQRDEIPALPPLVIAEKMKPLEVDALCARIVQRPGLDAKSYEEAESLARAMLERLNGSGEIQTTVGGAEYRLGKYDSALATLVEAGEKKRGWPANLAFRALALHKLERPAEARIMLGRLVTLLKEPRWAQDVEANAMLEEARSVIGK